MNRSNKIVFFMPIYNNGDHLNQDCQCLRTKNLVESTCMRREGLKQSRK